MVILHRTKVHIIYHPKIIIGPDQKIMMFRYTYRNDFKWKDLLFLQSCKQ